MDMSRKELSHQLAMLYIGKTLAGDATPEQCAYAYIDAAKRIETQLKEIKHPK